MPDFPHQHIRVSPDRKELHFQGNGRGKFKRRPGLSREQHAARLQRQLEQIEQLFSSEHERRKQETSLTEEFGLILNIRSAPGYSLKLDSLDKAPSKNNDGIYLLNVRREKTRRGLVTQAAILVPFGQLKVLARKVAAYANAEKDTTNKDGVISPKHADLLSNIDVIAVAALDALWMEPEPLPPPNELHWWELWVSRAPRAERMDRPWTQIFEETCKTLRLQVNQFRLQLPENEVVLVKARRSELESSLDLLNTLTEVRKLHPCSIDLSSLPGPEQHEWINEALDRIAWPSPTAPAVCILDTGVNRAHPLLQNVLAETDLNTVIPQYGTADHSNPHYAHGTEMAGIAVYDDLRNLMLSTTTWELLHRLESVKLIHEGNEHDAINYGAVTQDAIARPEVTAPRRQRVYCLALTQPDFTAQGQPSAWSAAIDAAAAGVGEEDAMRRLIFISAGNQRNFLDYCYPDSNYQSPIENPAQAWNAIAVGAHTKRCVITETDDESRRARSIAVSGGLSPFSRTSREWEPHWPIKPDIVMEGGNMAQMQSGEYIERVSLEPISTSPTFLTGNPLSNINATSAATASASRLGAILMAQLPNFWPETYRGLIVHSARWQPAMLAGIDPHQAGNTERVQTVLRTYGYGEPFQPRLFGSGESGVTMIIQDSIQPYNPGAEAGKAGLHHFHLHQLPWPQDVFDQHRDVELTLRVTLSYFIEPNPGSRCWERSQKYRYASHLLRFSFKRSTESDEVFRQALEKRIEEDEDQDDLIQEKRAPSDFKWALGPQLCGKSGSLVQDIWKGTPAELAQMGQVAIYPAKGWFATRSYRLGHEYHNCHQRQVRYSLIISLDAEKEIGLYTSISNILSVDA